MNHTLAMARDRATQGLIVLLFAIPLLAAWLMPAAGTSENRNLAPMPAAPASWSEAKAYPGKLDLWINDHLGLRNELIRWNNQVRFALFKQLPTHQLIWGRHGRLFTSAYSAADAPYSGIHSICGASFGDEQIPPLVAHVKLFNDTMRAQGQDAGLIIAPSAPVVYSGDLPGWLQRSCAATTPPIARVMASPQLLDHSRVLYPLAELRAISANAAVFPSTWFHWAGAGPRLAARLSMERFWHIGDDQSVPLHTRISQEPSDMAHLFQGFSLDSKVELVDFAASSVQECHGPTCFPELPDVMAKLWGVNRYRNPAAPLPRLVLVTDSFGIPMAPWYARYYRDVIQVATNDFSQLTPAEVLRLKTLLFQKQTPQQVLFVYHDGTVQGGGRIGGDLNILFPPQKN